jgi:hypothetical protein
VIHDLHDGVKIIQLLQSRLDATRSLDVIHEGAYAWYATFEFNPSADDSDINKIKDRWKLPVSYEKFLLLHNGALIFIRIKGNFFS